MGAEQSKSPTDGKEGFQIASVAPASPAHEGGLIPFFDFIIGTDNVLLDRENSIDFRDYIKKHKEEPITLRVYNIKAKTYRETVIVPSNSWGGVGLLGCSINWEIIDKALEYVWHITDVAADSPAAEAEIQPGRDYLLGTQAVGSLQGPLHIALFSDKGDFHRRVEYLNQLRENPQFRKNPRGNQLLLLLYDSIDNSVREVLIDLENKNSLGCDVANGFLHTINIQDGDTRLPVIRQFYVDNVEEFQAAPPAPAAVPPAAPPAEAPAAAPAAAVPAAPAATAAAPVAAAPAPVAAAAPAAAAAAPQGSPAALGTHQAPEATAAQKEPAAMGGVTT
eukprot:TRINITY_DN28678_c0_g1_i1.p1 TRINITY_DN28678_c0_g1~~TRINITY_DN28678_c0_g1_i1.p1  ORF type:complete len:349 (+),score=128.81 TRINITY_DN28678_c0_g1_i1:44-1048(+)